MQLVFIQHLPYIHIRTTSLPEAHSIPKHLVMVGPRFSKKTQSTHKTTATAQGPVVAYTHVNPGKLWQKNHVPSKLWYVLIWSFSALLILGDTDPAFLNSQCMSHAWQKKGRNWCIRKWVFLPVLILLISECRPESFVRVEEELHNHHAQHKLSILMLLNTRGQASRLDRIVLYTISQGRKYLGQAFK